MQNANLQELKEAAWRRPLTPDELARLRELLGTLPKARGEWESDMVLTSVLNSLPPAPVSSNFTSLVLQAVERTSDRTQSVRAVDSSPWFLSMWYPRLITAMAMVCISAMTVREYQSIQRQKMARDLARVSRLATLPPVEWLQNFDTINRINRVKVADDDLLLVLQ